MITSIDNLESGTKLTADVCIVGAGPVGISIALRLAGRGLDVVMLAGGGREETKAAQSLYAGDVVDPALHTPTNQYRHRVLGGATTTWGGRCVRFDPLDFEKRDWIPESGWPIGADEVDGYYADALALAEAGDDDYDAATAVKGGMRPMIAGWNSEDFDQGNLERFSCPTNFGKRWAGQLEEDQHLRVLLDAHATEIVTSSDGSQVDHLEIRTLAGKYFSLAAGKVILATGGIETPRLMLASQRIDRRGLGNANGLVGRYYMCHIAGSSGRVHFDLPISAIDNEYEQTWDGVYVRRRLQLRAEAQRRLRVGNIVIRLHHPRLPDPAHGRGILSLIYLAKPFIGYEYAKRLHSDDRMSVSMWARHVLNVVREGYDIVRFLVNWIRKRTLAIRKYPSLVVRPRNNIFTLEIHSEQMPNGESRVMLSDKQDPFGMPQVKVDWRCSPLDIETIRVTLETFDRDLREKRIGRVEFDPGKVEADMLRDGAFGGHHIGTTRMSSSAEEGVVDPDCKVFGIANLWIAGSSVFPTSSQANPTLLAIALALRLADHLTLSKGKAA